MRWKVWMFFLNANPNRMGTIGCELPGRTLRGYWWAMRLFIRVESKWLRQALLFTRRRVS